jgi:hypothetical protein
VSPASSAAVRVASFPIGVYTMRCTLPSNLSHHPALRRSTARTPGSQLSRMKGPVPIARRLEKASSFFVK